MKAPESTDFDKQVSVGIIGRDTATLSWNSKSTVRPALTGIGCLEFLKALEDLRSRLTPEIEKLSPPQGTNHASLILRELVLRAQGRWTLPYAEEELCHCRKVPTEVVCSAIRAGAHTPQAVTAVTSASTACGTCRPNVELLIRYLVPNGVPGSK